MSFKGMKIPIILGVFLITLTLALGAQKVMHQYRVITPMQSAFESIEGVEDVTLNQRAQGVELTLELGKVDSLSHLVSEVLEEASRSNVEIKLVIKTDDSIELREVYRRMNFAIEEAITLGNFREMARSIQEIAEESQVEYDIFVDSNYVYLALADGDQYLYRVIARGEAVRIKTVHSQGGYHETSV